MTITIRKAVTTADFEQGKLLFKEYAASLNFDLGYQDFENELQNITKQYSQPEGALLLYVTENGEAVGCVGIRKFTQETAELKRLYVKPDYRSLKIGKTLLDEAILETKRLRYDYIRLDTVTGQEKAQELYLYLGFYKIEPYRYSPVEGTIYFEKRLTSESSES